MRKSWTLIFAAALAAGAGAWRAGSVPSGLAATAADNAPASRPAKVEADEPFGPEDEAVARSSTIVKPLTEEQQKVVLEYLQTKRPEIYKQVMGYHETDLRRFHRATRSMWSFISRIKSLPEKVGQAYEARQMAYVRMWRLAREFDVSKDPAARADLEKQLLEFAQQQFDADQVIREHRLTELAEQITRMKAELVDRQKDCATIVREIAERMKKSAAHRNGSATKAPHTRPAGS